MFQRDYLMRMIEQMTEAIGQVMQLRKERKQEEALQLLDDLLDRQFGLSARLLRSLSDEDLVKMMTQNGIVQADSLQAIAVMFKQQSEMQEELGRDDESYELGLKALRLFMRLTLLGAPATVADSAGEARQLLAKLNAYELPEDTKLLQAEWHEAEGEYDLAENILYELYEDGYITTEHLEQFYRRLLLYGDDKLEAGGLPREEVETGLADLGSAHKE
ncbi:DUF6483 family protein [Paenibacillus thailandensis]|uniref:DUF6483 family protein n=1 Tax=Paenibacillus thailandensis TaxID=393250 RepID=A0ABW5QVT3_9BACL